MFKELHHQRTQEASRAFHIVYYIDDIATVWNVNLSKLSRNFVLALRTTTTNCRVMPHSHQSLSTFKSCLVKHDTKFFFFFIKAAY